MCRRIIASLLIFSLVWIDAALVTRLQASDSVAKEEGDNPRPLRLVSLIDTGSNALNPSLVKEEIEVKGNSLFQKGEEIEEIVELDENSPLIPKGSINNSEGGEEGAFLEEGERLCGSFWQRRISLALRPYIDDLQDRQKMISLALRRYIYKHFLKGKKGGKHYRRALRLPHEKISLLKEEQKKILEEYKVSVNQFAQSELDRETKTATHKCLLHIKDFIIDDCYTWRHFVADVAGLCIGIAKANAWPSIYLDGLTSLNNPWHESFKGTGSLLTNGIISFVAVTFGVDSAVRNIVILRDLWGPRTDDFSMPLSKWEKWKGAKSLIYGGISPTSAIPNTYYFFKVQFHDLQTGVNATDTKYFLGFLTPGVVLDAGFDTGYHIMKLLREREAEARNADYHRRKDKGEKIPEGEKIRHDYLDFLKGLKQIIPALRVSDPTAIRDLYEKVFVAEFGEAATRKGISPEDIDGMKQADALRILDVFETFYESHKENNLHPPEEQEGSQENDFLASEEQRRKEIISDTALVSTALATFTRSYLFFYTLYTMLDAAGSAMGIENSMVYFIFNLIASGVFGSVIGATAGQAPIEKMSIEECVQDFPVGISRSEATSFKQARMATKGFNYSIMAPLMWLPLIFTFMDATPGWGWWRLIPLLLALPANGADTAHSFNESSGHLITGVNCVVACVYQSLSHEIDRLTRVIRRLEEIFDTAREDVVRGIHRLRRKPVDVENAGGGEKEEGKEEEHEKSAGGEKEKGKDKDKEKGKGKGKGKEISSIE